MKTIFIIFFLLLLNTCGYVQVRQVLDFNKGWKFSLQADSTAAQINYDDANWRTLDLPHDWSIEYDFAPHAAATNQGGSLPGGIGWYRKLFKVTPSAKDKIATIVFDGVYKNSEVWINGHYLGKRPYGYIQFSYTLTPYLFYNKENVIAVKVDNRLQPDSRWYTGSGIYRDVKLITTSRVAISKDGLFITTPQVTAKEAIVAIRYHLNNEANKKVIVNLYTHVYDKAGKKIASTRSSILRAVPAGGYAYVDDLRISNPQLWSIHTPYMYKAVTKVEVDGRLIDLVETNFGIRNFNFDRQKGFYLNGNNVKIQGVCMHHDLGALGAAFNKTAARRQLTILKDMGCNAIRFSHNPPAAAMLDLCDEMGFLVIDEAYDIWKKKKNKYDYHLYFDEWGVKDLQDMVLRDRNHPCVIMWSIGNEQREQFDSTGTTIVKKLVDAVKVIDTTRPVTTALTETLSEKNFIAKAHALDVLGFNYKLYDYSALPKRFPGQKFIATETASALETRSVYPLPADSVRIWPPNYKAQDTFAEGYKNYTCAAYDNTHAYWGATHEKSWLAVKNAPHIAGAFVWSGFDYLGEPLPYPSFPARSSYYGIIDLAGFPKDVYYMYQSEWTGKPVLHLFPHWNWNRGDTVDVWAYYSQADDVELFLNNQSLGKRVKTDTTLHVSWRVPYAAGTLKIVSYKKGKEVLSQYVRTAGEPYSIKLSVRKKEISINRHEVAFVEATICDKKGNLVPYASDRIDFSTTGTGIVVGTDNGYEADVVSLAKPYRNAWMGKAIAIIKPGNKKGYCTVTATVNGLRPANISLSILE